MTTAKKSWKIFGRKNWKISASSEFLSAPRASQDALLKFCSAFLKFLGAHKNFMSRPQKFDPPQTGSFISMLHFGSSLFRIVAIY